MPKTCYISPRFDDLVLSLNVSEGLGRYRLLPTLLGHDHKKTWTEIVDRIASADKDKIHDNFETIIEEFLLTKIVHEITLDLKEWLRTIKKPRSMSIAEFVERLRHLNNLIEYCPVPDPNKPQESTPKLSDPELTVILKNACPKSWSVKQVEANLRIMTLQQQQAYFTGLRKIEGENSNSTSRFSNNQNRSTSNNVHNRERTRNYRRSENNNNINYRQTNNINRRGNNNSNRGSSNPEQKYCSIHGKYNHNTVECTLIQNQREQYNVRRQQRTNNDNKNRNNFRNHTNNNRPRTPPLWFINSNRNRTPPPASNKTNTHYINHTLRIALPGGHFLTTTIAGA